MSVKSGREVPCHTASAETALEGLPRPVPLRLRSRTARASLPQCCFRTSRRPCAAGAGGRHASPRRDGRPAGSRAGRCLGSGRHSRPAVAPRSHRRPLTCRRDGAPRLSRWPAEVRTMPAHRAFLNGACAPAAPAAGTTVRGPSLPESDSCLLESERRQPHQLRLRQPRRQQQAAPRPGPEASTSSSVLNLPAPTRMTIPEGPRHSPRRAVPRVDISCCLSVRHEIPGVRAWLLITQ